MALEQLGYDSTYHGYSAIFENSRDCEMCLEALDAKFNGIGKPFGRYEFDQLLGHCQVKMRPPKPSKRAVVTNTPFLIIQKAVTDAPAICFAAELIAAYPEAKVILTNRDIDSWYE